MYSKESGIKIIKTDIKKEGVTVSGDLLQSSFIAAIIGPPGTGKSTLIETLITHEKLYFKKFHKIIFITPSKYELLDLIEDENWWPRLNTTWLSKKLNDENEIGIANNQVRQMLIVLDDCVSEINKSQTDDFLVKLFYNRRHLLSNIYVSIIVVSQKYNMIPLKFRSIITMLFLFKVPISQWNEIKKELTVDNISSLTQLLPALWKNRHDFVLINNNNDFIFHNFNKLLF